MSATPISRNPDLAKLQADGFRLRVVEGCATHLLIEGIPSVNAQRAVVKGTLYCPLGLDQNGRTDNPCGNHQCWWIGEAPCDATGRLMTEMISNPGPEDKGDGIQTTVGFSRKHVDKTPWADYHEKMWGYVRMIWHEARAIDPSCDPRSEKPVAAVLEALPRVFRYPDMATTRAGIGAATAKLLADRVAFIGLGGTGGYMLDLVAKTPVRELHLFDGDIFKLHNAFRAPGAPAVSEFTEQKKVDYFAAIYSRMHAGIVPHPYYIDAANLQQLAGFDFAFVAVDKGAVRKIILPGLLALKVPFIDVGLDVDFDSAGKLRGKCRVTVATPDFHGHLEEAVSLGDGAENEIYRNIQVADLNMMNAAMAVHKWKKLRGFYADNTREHQSCYTTALHSLGKEFRS